MAEILDNEAITADILNEISTDLGYSELKFTDNEKFGNDKLNLITGDLVGSGILNVGNKCIPTFSEEKIWIDTGVVVFSDGAKKRITEKTGLDIFTDEMNYIYAKNDTSTGKIYLISSSEEPTGDFVLLATVNADGSITDRRAFSKAKVELSAEGNSYSKKISHKVGSDTEPLTIALSIAKASKIFMKSNYCGYNSIKIFDVETNTFSGHEYIGSDRQYNWYTGRTYFEVGNTAGSINYVIERFISNENDIVTFEIDFSKGSIDYLYEAEFYVFGGLEK